MFEAKIIDEIKKIWDTHKVGGDYVIVPELDIGDLRVIVETSFFASLKKEESLPIDFSVALISEDEISKLNSDSRFNENLRVMKFSSQIDFNEKSISKLANAFDKNTTALMVEPIINEFNKDYKIWGAMYFGHTQNFFDFYGSTRPNCLIVTVLSPGSLRLSRGPFVVGYFSLGEITPVSHSPFAPGAMEEYIQPLLNYQNTPNYGYGNIKMETLKFLLSESACRGHGSTIIIIPQDQSEVIKNIICDGYTFTGNLDISSLLGKWIDNRHDNKYPHGADLLKRFIAPRISALAQLSAVDGALLLTPDWEVISFGTKIIAEKWKGNVLAGPEAFKNGQNLENIDPSQLGNRHNSTINFIGKCPGAVAFVISEDGPIRGLVLRDSETVLFWNDCRNSGFIESSN